MSDGVWASATNGGATAHGAVQRALRPLERLCDSRANYMLGYVSDALAFSFFSWLGATRSESTPALVLVLLGLGWLFWTLLEYLLHRWLFHGHFWTQVEIGHKLHHDDPRAFVSVPFFSGACVAGMLWLALALALPIGVASAFIAGGLLGYAVYGGLHHAEHVVKGSFKPYRRLCARHKIHHKLPDRNFGVTTSLWDRVFRTDHGSMRPPVRRSPRAPLAASAFAEVRIEQPTFRNRITGEQETHWLFFARG